MSRPCCSVVPGISHWRWLALAAFLVSVSGARGAEDEPASPDKKEQDEKSKRRLEIMKSAIDDFKITSNANLPKSALAFAKTPLLRYNDEARGFLDAGVWRLGETGRPIAFLTIELYRAGEAKALLTYEFISLSPAEFTMFSTRGIRWSPSQTELKMSPLPDAPAPADNAKARLTQLRQLARRFAVHEDHAGNKVECRLMPAPIDRYADPDHKIVDGAVFAFATGTNPELGLLLETDGKEWSYGVFRMGAAALFIDLDDKPRHEIPNVQNYSSSASYTAARHSIALPE
jgi:hypothetical protein